jgi:hypothetical protein
MSNYTDAADLLEDARNQVLELLSDRPNLTLQVKTSMNLLINRLRTLGGTKKLASETKQFEPVTSVMGVPVSRAPLEKNIAIEEMTPAELERKNFIDKVNKLQANIFTLTNEQILDAYKVEPLVLRGVARRAGLDHFKTAEINGTFLDEIREGLRAQEKGMEEIKEVNKAINEAED